MSVSVSVRYVCECECECALCVCVDVRLGECVNLWRSVLAGSFIVCHTIENNVVCCNLYKVSAVNPQFTIIGENIYKVVSIDFTLIVSNTNRLS